VRRVTSARGHSRSGHVRLLRTLWPPRGLDRRNGHQTSNGGLRCGFEGMPRVDRFLCCVGGGPSGLRPITTSRISREITDTATPGNCPLWRWSETRCTRKRNPSRFTKSGAWKIRSGFRCAHAPPCEETPSEESSAQTQHGLPS